MKVVVLAEDGLLRTIRFNNLEKYFWFVVIASWAEEEAEGEETGVADHTVVFAIWHVSFKQNTKIRIITPQIIRVPFLWTTLSSKFLGHLRKSKVLRIDRIDQLLESVYVSFGEGKVGELFG